MQLMKRLVSRRFSCLLVSVVLLLAASTYFMAWDMDALTGVEFDDYDDDVTVDPMSDGEDDEDEEMEQEGEEDDDEQRPAAAAAAAAGTPPPAAAGVLKLQPQQNDSVARQQMQDGPKRRGIKGIDNPGGGGGGGGGGGPKHRGKKRKKHPAKDGTNTDVQAKDESQQHQTMDGDDENREDQGGADDNVNADNKNNVDAVEGKAAANEESEEGVDDNGDAGQGQEGEAKDGVNNGNEDYKNDNDNAADSNNGKSYDTCDDECKKFRSELASWPPNKPKAFIYYLIHRPAMRSLRKSIQALHRNFNRRFRYPIVVFVEPNMDNQADRRRIAEMVPTDTSPPPPPIYVQIVKFRIPEYVNVSLVPRMAGFGQRKRTIGYRHMCRFHASGVYEQPIVQSPGLEYGWRLDDDSLIRRPINYDLFKEMRDNGYQYGYRRINTGWSPVDFALWDAVDRYLNATPSLKPTFYRQWPKNKARYFNNFEISDLHVWLSPQYREYFRYIDRLGGIYYHKWGDAAIKTIAVTLFIPRERTHLFTGITYAHN